MVENQIAYAIPKWIRYSSSDSSEVARKMTTMVSVRLPKLNPMATMMISLALLSVFAFHFSVVRRNAVNLPHGDEWGLLYDDHPAALNAKWLYEQVNDHRTATTKLFVWAQYHIDGWNVRTQLEVSFVIYGLTLVLLILFVRQLFHSVPTWMVGLFVLFQLSTIIWPDHVLAYALAIHFWMLFFILAMWGLFSRTQRWTALAIGATAAIASTYSFASGVVTSGVLLLFFVPFKIARVRSMNERRRREVVQLCVITIVIAAGLAAWVTSYRRPSYQTFYAWPYTREFWSFFLNLVSVSFGFDNVARRWGVLCLFLIVAPIVITVAKKQSTLTAAQYANFALIAAVLADLAAIAVGRAFLGVYWSKVGEYAEHGMPLMLLTAVNWYVLLRPYRGAKWIAVGALWLFCFGAFADNWNLKVYDSFHTQTVTDYRCVEAYYAGAGDGHCRGTFGEYPHPEVLLNNARRLNISFYTEMTDNIRHKQNAIP
jgi:hypothetical protein